MSARSNIEWCDHSQNFWLGCTMVGPGCLHCYAWYLLDRRLHRVEWGKGKPRVRTTLQNRLAPYSWNARATEQGRRERVFCSSLSDVFDEEVPQSWREEIWEVIQGTPSLDWLTLTKRPQLIKEMLPADYRGWLNLWLGTSIENGDYLWRAQALAEVPAPVHFLSLEPLLGPIDLRPLFASTPQINWWIIVGGESGPGARPMQLSWARDLRDQCQEWQVPFFFKQIGGVRKKVQGRLLDGEIWEQFPDAAATPTSRTRSKLVEAPA